MATTKKSTARITLRTVIEHMDRKFQLVDTEMRKEFKAVHEKIEGVERRLTRQIDGLDKRLDDIEVNVVPALKKAVGTR